MTTRSAINTPTFPLAATGIKRVAADVKNTPNPNKFFPPNLRANKPPGNWVKI